MEIGTVVIHKKQQYELEAFQPYIRRDGLPTELAVFRSHCKRCGEPFTMTVPSLDREPRLTSFNKRCKAHAIRRPK